MLEYDRVKGVIRGTIKSPLSGRAVKVEDDLKWATEEDLKNLQIEVYVMCGGGLLGDFATTQPADFYIDVRVGKLPYPKRDVIQAVKVLEAMAIKLGKNPHDLPRPNIVSAWIF
jgi:hypothetical protein